MKDPRETKQQTVLVADDDATVRDALGRMVNSIDGFRCVGALDSADSLIAAIIKLQPEVVIVDLRMPGRNVYEAITELCQYLRYDCRVVVVSGVCERMPVQTLMTLGAAAYVVKEDGPEAIRTALKAVTSSQRWLSPSAAALFTPAQLSILTGATRPPQA